MSAARLRQPSTLSPSWWLKVLASAVLLAVLKIAELQLFAGHGVAHNHGRHVTIAVRSAITDIDFGKDNQGKRVAFDDRRQVALPV